MGQIRVQMKTIVNYYMLIITVCLSYLFSFSSSQCKKSSPKVGCFKKCAFDVRETSIINKETDTELQQLFAQISSENTLDEYIHFDSETIIPETISITNVD